MHYSLMNGVSFFHMDLVSTTALVGILLLIGYAIRAVLPVFQRLCIPASVIGGLCFAIVAWGLRSNNILRFDVDVSLQTPFMLAFFTCVGLSGSFALLKAGGKTLILFLICTWVMILIQNGLGLVLASGLHINPVLGVMAGGVSLVGGHGNAAAFGPVAEAAGVKGATTVAIASATYGLIVGALLGGPFARYLIDKYKLPIQTAAGMSQPGADKKEQNEPLFSAYQVIIHLVFISIFVVVGIMFSYGIAALHIPNLAIPNYVGAMFIAIIFRNVNDKFKLFKMDHRILSLILDVSLAFFLTMAIMTLKIWELAGLAIPLIIILVVQTIVVLAFARFVVWLLMRKDYDASVMCSGFIGASLGVAATAVANMTAVCERYNLNSYKAFVIVPLCCAVFVDIVGIPSIIFCIQSFS